jgi:Domain of unknown function (DUF6089)
VIFQKKILFAIFFTLMLMTANTYRSCAAKHKSVWSNQSNHSKNYFDVGMATGLGNYYGDIVPTLFSFQQLHPDLGIFARYNIGNYFSIRSTAIYGSISGDDKYYNNKPRNLSFRSELEELSLTFEINLLPFHHFDRRKNGFAPYLFFGIAGFHFNPEAELNGTWYYLQPLGTEGQGISPAYGSKYSLLGISIPIGGGLKYRFETSYNHYITIGAEFGIRKTFTDYLDDVSTSHVSQQWYDSIKTYNGTLAADFAWREDEYYAKTNPEIKKGTWIQDIRRGNSSNKDWYYFGNITVSYVFGRTTKLHFAR